jgi:hypothetical protein
MSKLYILTKIIKLKNHGWDMRLLTRRQDASRPWFLDAVEGMALSALSGRAGIMAHASSGALLTALSYFDTNSQQLISH